jgi:TrmH family RNA methyltransferase
MANSYKVFHSDRNDLRRRVHAVLVRPEVSANVGSVARALANMGIDGELILVADRKIVDGDCLKLAKHAAPRFETARFVSSLAEAFKDKSPGALTMAATARVGSPHRPHPLRVREAMEKAVEKLVTEEQDSLYLVFGPESDGLRNEEIELCDWVVTIPSSPGYRSLNLAQSVLLFSYEVHMNLLKEWPKYEGARTSQKNRLVQHLIKLAEAVGFVLPGDPMKMRPRLEEIFSHLPNHIKDVKTLHGLIDQTIRSVQKGEADFKGRYRHWVASHQEGSSEIEDEKRGL